MKLSLPADLEKFKFYFEKLQSYQGMIELRKINRPRTIQQNKFLHVLITLFAIETGYTIDEMKTHLKRNCSFMRYKKETIERLKLKTNLSKQDEIFLKKSSQLDTKGLADWITWIRNYAGMNGIYLPSSDEYFRNWSEIEKTIEANKSYL